MHHTAFPLLAALNVPSLLRSFRGLSRCLVLGSVLALGACADDERGDRDGSADEASDDERDAEEPAAPDRDRDAEPVLAADAQAPNDAGLPRDAASARDAGSVRDAGAPRDAGTRTDASSQQDASLESDAGRNGDAGGADIGPSGCLEKFKPACTPMIVFRNDEPTGRGAIFASVVPDPVATMQDAICSVCSILFREPSEIPMRSRHQTVNLTLRDNPNVADASGNSIRIDLKHINGYKDPAKALREFRGIMVHEGAHLYQNYGNGGLGEGMADFVRIRVGLYEPGRRRPGGAWTDPYTTSGFFFSWLAGPGVYHKDGRQPHDVDIGYMINKTIGAEGPDAVPALLQKTFGADVDTLWRQYQDAIQ
jgi:hypothetical protein